MTLGSSLAPTQGRGPNPPRIAPHPTPGTLPSPNAPPPNTNPFLESIANNPVNDPLPTGTAPDASWLAFMRQLGFNESQAYTTSAQTIDRLKRDLILGTGNINQQGVVAREGITNGALARGTFRSGERLQDLAQQRAQQQTQINQATNQSAEQIGQARSGLQQQLGDLARQRADQVLGLQQRNAATQASLNQPITG